MKILFIIESLARGGTERGLVNLLPVFRARGLECEVAVLWPPYTLAPELEKNGILVHRLDMTHRWSVIKNTFKIAKILHSESFDLVHARLFFASLYTALSRPLRPSIYRVTSFHNLGYASYPANTLWKKFRKQIHSLLTRYWIDGHVAVSTATAQHYSTHLKLPHVEVIHNGFPVDDILQPVPKLDRQKVLARYGIISDEFVAIVPGRLIFEKAHRILLQSLTILRKKKLFPRVLIFGDGPLQNELRQTLVAEQLLGQVVLHGAIPHKELMRVVQAADIFVMASIFEGFPHAPGEAMALAKPVIATRVGGLTDLIEDGVSGLLVPPGDAGSLADRIAQLMADPALRERLGQGGRQRIETCFSVDAIAERYVRYYETLLTNKKNRHYRK
ncbi:MAG: glycosyltransferase family 4 protein [Pseudomonadota bacterium]